MRATYNVKLILSSPLLQSSFLFCYEQYGWHNKDGNTQLTWKTGHPSTFEEASDSESDLDSAVVDTDPEQAESSDSEEEVVGPTIANDSFSEDEYEPQLMSLCYALYIFWTFVRSK